ncbi:amidase [Mesorhizobium sp.]|uniref:amidase n=1 Tax=Mesorhizobium sp. TaxID=1871066 RepID=UPI000FE94F07|nr:amidase [Mesorhizobium sp.]RWP99096.1 MAG: amidase [Mesorhizobium sp.]
MTIQRPSLERMHELAGENHFAIRSDEEKSYVALFDRILELYDLLDDGLAAAEANAPQRDAGYRPSADENFCNAFVRKLSIKGASHGPLAGRRIAIKDNISLAGVPMTCGSAVISFTPTDDATIVTRMLDAGAEIVGIVNMDNLAFSGAGDTSAYGPTRNPHDEARLAGGSSGGSAAALLSGEVDITIGGDQAGSIRIPASWCGVVGLKPTYGLVPYSGILGYDLTFDHTGPMARKARDVATTLAVIAGKDAEDPRQRDAALPNDVTPLTLEHLRGLRIGILTEGFCSAGHEADVDQTVRRAAENLATLGATVSEISFPGHLKAGPIVWGVFAEGVTATFQGNGHGYHWDGAYNPALADAFGSGIEQRGNNMPLQAKFNLMLGTYMRQTYHGKFYAYAQNLRRELRGGYDRLLESVDVLLMPTTPMKAHMHNPNQTPEELVLAGWNMVANTAPFNMTGHPALSVPCGMSEGLPVGMMLVGKKFDDQKLLAIADAYQRTFDNG